jgi:hypothetical protein
MVVAGIISAGRGGQGSVVGIGLRRPDHRATVVEPMLDGRALVRHVQGLLTNTQLTNGAANSTRECRQ